MHHFIRVTYLAACGALLIGGLGCANALVTEPQAVAAPSNVHPENRSLRPRSSLLSQGTVIPSFVLFDQNGVPVTTGELAAGRGGALIFFVPSVHSPGARPAVDFARRNQGLLGQRGTEILIVTPNTIEENRAFAERESLRLGVLSDPNAWVARAFGYNPEATGSATTYVLGNNGRVQLSERTIPDVSRVIMAVEAELGRERLSVF